MKYYYVAIPLDAFGRGPVSRREAVSYSHEVWDELNRTVHIAPDEKSAKKMRNLLTREE